MEFRKFYGLKRPAPAEEEDPTLQEGGTTVSAALSGGPSIPPAGQITSFTSSAGSVAPSCTRPLSSRHTVAKKGLFEPEPVHKVFPRQKKAIDFARNCYQNVAVFAFESEELGKNGQRRYVATTYYEFGKRYLKMAPADRHYYEVILEGAACRLYFDIEFIREFNPTVEPIFLLDTFIELHAMYHVTCDRTNVMDLDSSVPNKFSRHLIFHLPLAVFRNNLLVGEFVRSICDQLRKLNRHVECGMKTEEAFELVYSTSKGSKRDIPCPPCERLLQLFVKNKHGKKVLICDEAVYTRNRNFRLYLSSKLGKTAAVLRVAKESKFKSSYSESTTRRNWSRRFNTLMDSLICNISFQSTQHMRILPTATRQTKLFKHPEPTPLPATVSEFVEVSAKPAIAAAEESETGFNCSPFPLVDSFITSKLTKGGVQGSIRRWTYFPEGKMVLYDIQHNRWCENIGRAHKSNNIMMIADLKRGTYYQKCHDPDCKRVNFRSNEITIPLECNPVLKQLEEERTRATCDRTNLNETQIFIGDVSLEDIEQFEEDALIKEVDEERRKFSSSVIEVEGDTSLEDFEGMEVTPSAKQQQISNSAQLEDAEVRIGHIISGRKPLEERKLTEQLHSSRQEVKQRRQDSHKTLCEEPKLYLGDTSLSDIERFEETAGSSSVRESGISLADLEDDDSLDSILREALENYESLLLPGDN